jgi:DNA primase
VAGRIRDEDVVLVKERADVGQVVGDHVTLRSAGGGSLKGLCPFHDEKSPSFHVTPGRGFWHCFGCGQGGDVIDFLMQVEHTTFAETVERLAGRVGVQLRYEEGGYTPRGEISQRSRLLEAHKAAAEFYAEQLATPEAVAGRRFLDERGFDRAAAARFGVGYAPRTWEALVGHLRGRGFTEAELTVGGLAQQGQRGLRDRFVGRLVWPIRDITGDVIGFGARRVHDDDRIEAKYLNTAETPIYRKSTVLYGVDVAKKEIARRHQAVVVEGYTDVMACHLSGVETAIATCGTAFGGEHIKVLRRLLMDQDEFRGEVIFTFDGDAAGQKAALRAFQDDQRFVTQTFVAIERAGMDPCDLRLDSGEEAVRDLVARRVPLFEFAIRSVLERYDLDTPEGRVAALRGAAPVVASIRDRSLRPEYARTLAGWLGMDVDAVVQAVANVGREDRRRGRSEGGTGDVRRTAPADATADVRPSGPPGAPGPDGQGGSQPAPPRPHPGDPRLFLEREALKLAIQAPHLVGTALDGLDVAVFTAPAYAAVRAAVAAAGGTEPDARGEGGEAWVSRVRAAAADPTSRGLVTELAVEGMHNDVTDARYARSILARVQEVAVTRRVTELKGRLQRLNPVDQVEAYNRMFGELVALERDRLALRERAIGAL